MTPATIPALLQRGRSDAAAIGGPGRTTLTFGALLALSERTGASLRAAGVGRAGRVAIVLPNGPEMAACLLSVCCHAAAAPLNPAYRAEELSFALGDLGAQAIILRRDDTGPARDVAVQLGLTILELAPGQSAGDFSLVSPAALTPVPPQAPQPDDTALLLHTSGTTARPKLVPLSHANLAVSAANIARSLALGPDDVCLNVMPLFHIHGIVAALLASLHAGGSVVCLPGLNPRFFAWFDEVRPSWFTAVPTMLQILLELVPHHRDALARGRLRLVRSSSASLPAPVMQSLEQAFGVPVIEAYGMTEASHQMASNPLPPGERLAGWVGMAAGPEVAVVDAEGTVLPAGSVGEVVIRGASVMAGYENNPEANAESFTNGWFRTGDEGVLNAAGYLRLTGRLKEIINRAGEKISPLEVDSVLLRHPDVRQAATFAMPSRLFGEDVAAAVVLRPGAGLDAEALRQFALMHLAAFKVPRRIAMVDDIPKGATGKLQRTRLAALLGLSD